MLLFSFIEERAEKLVSISLELTEFEPPFILRPNFSAICTEVGIEAVKGVVGVGISNVVTLFTDKSKLLGIILLTVEAT
jgi:hypothetical protein